MPMGMPLTGAVATPVVIGAMIAIIRAPGLGRGARWIGVMFTLPAALVSLFALAASRGVASSSRAG